MSNNKYIFKFTPTGPYFFGSENRKVTDDTANYFLRSLAFPQQSSVLGAIRYYFLKFVCQKNIFEDDTIKDKSLAKDKIGNESFNLNGTLFDFGNIKGISEVFLVFNNNYYLPLSFDKWDDKFGEVENVESTDYYFLPHYDAKEYYEKKFGSSSSTCLLSEIFIEHIQSGNKKSNKGDEDEDGFYKQQFYRMTQGWSFGVELETDLDLTYLLDTPNFMTMGGENRLFKIELHKSDYHRENVLPTYDHRQYYKLVLVSDTYVGNNKVNEGPICSFTSAKSFRYLRSAIANTSKYRNRSTSKDSMNASSLYEVLDRGSTFFFADVGSLNDFEKKLDNDYLQKCGMNKYVTLAPKK